MEWDSGAIWWSGLKSIDMAQNFGNPKNTSGWTDCNLFLVKLIYFKLINPYNKSPSKCSIKLSTNTRYARQFIFWNLPGVISRKLLPHIDSDTKFLSPLNSLNFIVSISQSLTQISSSSVCPLAINLSFTKDVMLLLSSRSFRTFVGKIKGILFNDEIEQSTWYPPGSYHHSAGHSIDSLVGWITTQNQNITGLANNNDTNTTVSLDGKASCCNLHRERKWYWML